MSADDLRLAAILHAEIADPDSLFARGKDLAIQVFSTFHERIRQLAETCGGTLLSASRGEVVIAFNTSASALAAALNILDRIPAGKDTPKDTPVDDPLPMVRIGISLGDVLFTPAGAFGKAADIAEELVRAVPHGGLCVSADAWHASHPAQLRAKPVRLELPDQSRLDAFIVEKSILDPSASASIKTVQAASPQDQTACPSREAARLAIYSRIKEEGRRLSVEEAKQLARTFGAIAEEIVTELAAKGILVSSNAGRNRTRSRTAAPEVFSAETARETPARSARSSSARIPVEEKKRQTRDPARQFSTYVAELTKTAQKLKASLAPSIISWLGINAALWYVNINYADDIPWAIPITVMWFFGLLKKTARVVQSKRIAQEAENLPPLAENELKEYKSINKDRVAFLSRFFSFFSVSSLLMFINIMTDWSGPWFLIPTALLAVNLIARSIDYLARMPARRRRFFESLRSAFRTAPRAQEDERSALGPYAEYVEQARRDAAACLETYAMLDKSDVSQIKISMQAYLDQVLLLARTLNDIDQLMGSIPIASLEKDRAVLEARMNEASPELAEQYRKNIEEIDAQSASHRKLVERREALETKLRSAVNQLRQLSLDLAAARAAGAQSEIEHRQQAVSALGMRTEELRKSLEDLRGDRDDWLSREIDMLSRKAESQKGT